MTTNNNYNGLYTVLFATILIVSVIAIGAVGAVGAASSTGEQSDSTLLQSDTPGSTANDSPTAWSYTNDAGVVETQGLLDAIGDFRDDELSTDTLVKVVLQSFRSGDPVAEFSIEDQTVDGGSVLVEDLRVPVGEGLETDHLAVLGQNDELLGSVQLSDLDGYSSGQTVLELEEAVIDDVELPRHGNYRVTLISSNSKPDPTAQRPGIGQSVNLTIVDNDVLLEFREVNGEITTDPATEGDNLTAYAAVENLGDGTQTRNVTFLVDGAVIEERKKTLDPGERQKLLFTYQTVDGDSPSVGVSLAFGDTDPTAATEAEVERVRSASEFTINIEGITDPVLIEAGETSGLEVELRIENLGGDPGTAKRDVALEVNGFETDNQTIELDDGETIYRTFSGDGYPPQNFDDLNVTAVVRYPDGDTSERTVGVIEPESILAGELDIEADPGISQQDNNITYTLRSNLNEQTDIKEVLVDFDNASGVNASAIAQSDVNLNADGSASPSINGLSEEAPSVLAINVTSFSFDDADGNVTVDFADLGIPNDGNFTGVIEFRDTDNLGAFARNAGDYEIDPAVGSLAFNQQVANDTTGESFVVVENVDSNVDSAIVITNENNTGQTTVAGIKQLDRDELDGTNRVVKIDDTTEGFPGEHTAHLVPLNRLSSSYQDSDVFSGASADAALGNESAVVHDGNVTFTDQGSFGNEIAVDETLLEPLPETTEGGPGAPEPEEAYSVAIHDVGTNDIIADGDAFSDVLTQVTNENVSVDGIELEDGDELFAMAHFAVDRDARDPTGPPVQEAKNATGEEPALAPLVSADAEITVVPDSVSLDAEPSDETVTVDEPRGVSGHQGSFIQYTVTATDANDNPLQGVRVTADATDGENVSIDRDGNETEAITGADGQVVFNVTSTVAEEDVEIVFTERKSGESPPPLSTESEINNSVSGLATFEPDQPANLTATPGDDNATVSDNRFDDKRIEYDVLVEDRFGNPVPGVDVGIFADAGEAIDVIGFDADDNERLTTNETGYATFPIQSTVRQDDVEIQFVEQATGQTPIDGVFTVANATFEPEEPATVEVSPTDATTAISTSFGSGNILYTVTVRDKFDNPVAAGIDVEADASAGTDVVLNATATGTTEGSTTVTNATNDDGQVAFESSSNTSQEDVEISFTEQQNSNQATALASFQELNPDEVLVEPADATTTVSASADDNNVTFTATVEDEEDNPVPGVQVIIDSDGEDIDVLQDPGQVSDENGEVVYTVSSETAQENVTFVFQEQINNIQVNATATFEPDVPESLSADDVTVLSTSDNQQFTALVTDQFGNELASEQVNVTANDSLGGLSVGDSETTDSDGIATFGFDEAEAGTYDLTLAVNGTSITENLTVTVVKDDPSNVSMVIQPADTTAGENIQGAASSPTVNVTDEAGNPIGDVEVEVYANDTDGGVQEFADGSQVKTTTTADNGNATFDLLEIQNAGEYTLTFVGPFGDTATSQTFNITAAEPGTLVAPDTRGTAGENGSFNVSVLDEFGNRIMEDRSLTVAVVDDPDSLDNLPSESGQDADGFAEFTFNETVAGDYELFFELKNDATVDDNNTVTIDPANASQLAFDQQPTDTAAGDRINPAITVDVLDEFGNLVDTYFGNVSLAIAEGPAAGKLDGETEVDADAGVATFDNVSIDETGEYKLNATDPAGDLANDTSLEFEILPEDARNISIVTQPADSVADENIGGPPTVNVTDEAGNPVPGVDVEVYANDTDGGVQAFADGSWTKVTTTTPNGTAAFTGLQIDEAGEYDLTFTAAVANVTSETFTISAANATSVSVDKQPDSAQTAGKNLTGPPRALVTDEFGNPVTGADVSVTAEVGNGSIVPGTGTVATGTDGTATFDDLNITEADGYELEFGIAASGDNVSTDDTARTDEFTVAAAAADSLVVQRQPQDTTAGDQVGGQPIVRLSDEFDNPVSGVDVSVDANSTTLTGTTVAATGATGNATFADLVIETAGTYDLTFQAGSVGLSTTSDAFEVSPANASSLSAPDVAETAGEQGAINISVTDEFGNDVTGDQVNVTSNVAGLTGISVGDSDTATDGEVAFLFTETATGDYSVEFALDDDGTVTDTSTVTIEAANATSVAAATEPDDSIAGQDIGGPPEALVTDQYDNPVAGVEVNVTAQDGAGSLTDSSTTDIATGADGVATFDELRIETADDYRLNFTIDSADADVDTTDFNTTRNFTIGPSDASNLTIVTGPAETSYGDTINGSSGPAPQVNVTNGFGNPIEGAEVTVSAFNAATDAPQEFVSEQTVSKQTNESGVVTFDSLVIEANGTFSLEFETSGVAPVNSTAFDVLDQTGPSVSADTPAQDSNTSDTQQLIKFVVSDGESGINASSIAVDLEDSDGTILSDTGVQNGSVTFDETSSPSLEIDISDGATDRDTFADGWVNVSVFGADRAANNASDTLNFTVDSDGPTVRINDFDPGSNPSSAVFANDESVAVNYTAVDGPAGIESVNLTLVDTSDPNNPIIDREVDTGSNQEFDIASDNFTSPTRDLDVTVTAENNAGSVASDSGTITVAEIVNLNQREGYDNESLQTATNDANDGEELELDNTTFTNDVTVGNQEQGLTITGQGNTSNANTENTTIDGNVTLTSGSENVTIRNLTIIGDVFDNGVNNKLQDVNVTSASPGGAISLGDRSSGTVVTNVKAERLSVAGTDATVEGSTLGNTTVSGSDNTVTDTRIEGNYTDEGTNNQATNLNVTSASPGGYVIFASGSDGATVTNSDAEQVIIRGVNAEVDGGEIGNASASGSALLIEGDDATIRNAVIVQTSGTGLTVDGSSNSRIENSNFSGLSNTGIVVDSQTGLKILNNIFDSNDIGIEWNDGSDADMISGNNFSNHGTDALVLNTGVTLNATENYWNAANGPSGNWNDGSGSGSGDSVDEGSGEVLIAPWTGGGGGLQAGTADGTVTASGETASTSNVVPGGQGIEGATVEIYYYQSDDSGSPDHQTTTDSNGDYSIPDVATTPAGYDLHHINVTASNYVPNGTSLNISDAATNTTDLQLNYSDPGSVSGTVTASGDFASPQDNTQPQGNAIEGLTVELYDLNDNTVANSTTTDANGNYSFDPVDVNVGSGYNITVRGGANYSDASTAPFEVNVSEDVTKNVQMDYSDVQSQVVDGAFAAGDVTNGQQSTKQVLGDTVDNVTIDFNRTTLDSANVTFDLSNLSDQGADLSSASLTDVSVTNANVADSGIVGEEAFITVDSLTAEEVNVTSFNVTSIDTTQVSTETMGIVYEIDLRNVTANGVDVTNVVSAINTDQFATVNPQQTITTADGALDADNIRYGESSETQTIADPQNLNVDLNREDVDSVNVTFDLSNITAENVDISSANVPSIGFGGASLVNTDVNAARDELNITVEPTGGGPTFGITQFDLGNLDTTNANNVSDLRYDVTLNDVTVSGADVTNLDPALPKLTDTFNIQNITTSAVHRWRLDEGSGSTFTDSIGSVDGSFVSPTPSWESGNYVGGSALDFGGTNDRAETDSGLDVYDGTDMAIAFTLETTNPTDNEVLFASSQQSDSFRVRINDTGFSTLPNLVVEYGSGGREVGTTNIAYDGTKKRVVINLNSSASGADAADIFINGSEVSTSVNGPLLFKDLSGEPLTFGAQTNNANRYNGVLDDVLLFEEQVNMSERKNDLDRQPWSGVNVFDWNDLDDVRNNPGANVSLRTDLDKNSDGYGSLVNTANGWKPIGNPYTGSFFGNGNEIADLFIDRGTDTEVGLFGRFQDSVVQDLTMSNVTVNGSDRVGSFAGSFSGDIRSVNITSGDISSTTTGNDVGGLVGEIEGSSSTLNSSFANATVSNDGTNTGGLVGQAGLVFIKNSFATGNVTSSGDRVGGLVGLLDDGSVNNSYATGKVTGTDRVGGLLGQSTEGLVNFTFATGNVTGNTAVGGLVGDTRESIGFSSGISESYYDNSSTGTTQNSAVGAGTTEFDVEGLLTNQMQGSAASGNMTVFDFTSTWATVTGPDDYPVLQAIPEQKQLDARN